MKQTVLFHIHAIFNDHIQWAFLKLSIKEIYFYDEWLLTVSIKATNQDVKKTAKLAKKKLRKIIVHHDHEMTSQWYIVNAFFSIHHFYLCFRNLFSICSGRVFFCVRLHYDISISLIFLFPVFPFKWPLQAHGLARKHCVTLFIRLCGQVIFKSSSNATMISQINDAQSKSKTISHSIWLQSLRELADSVFHLRISLRIHISWCCSMM